MRVLVSVNNFCTPASVFLVLSFMSLLYLFLLDVKLTGYCFVAPGARRACGRAALQGWLSTLVASALVLAWAWVLDFLCRHDWGLLSWALVFLPHALFLLTADVRALVA